MRKRRVMKRVRVISLLLCVVMVFGMIPVMGASAAEEKLTVSQTKADLPKNGSVELTASCAAENTALAYQWQILVPGADLWVDISGENSASIKVTYAMVANLLSDGKATLRAKSEISGETVCTDEVTITVTEPVATVSAAPATTFALKKAATRTNAAAQPVDLSALKAKAEEAKAEEPKVSALQMIKDSVKEDDSKPLSQLNLRSILGGDILYAELVRRQLWLIVIMVAFVVVYVASRYQCQQDMIKIANMETELKDAKYRALSISSKLTEKCRESHVLQMLKENNDSLLKMSDQPPYIIQIQQ